MIRNFVTELEGIGLYGAISFCMFGSVFIGAFVWALLLKKPFLATMEALPLEDDHTAMIRKGEQPHE